MSNMPFVTFLRQHNDAAWAGVIAKLLPAIHPVDAAATQIWFKFWPYDLRAALDRALDRAQLEKRLLLQGKFYLQDHIDASHAFFYGHAYWQKVKQAVCAYAAQHESGDVAEAVSEVAASVAAQVKDDKSLLAGITAVAFMTLQHVGLDALQAAPGLTAKKHFSIKSPAKILSERQREESQGLFGFLRTADKQWTITFDENDPRASFKTMDAEEIASGAARDNSQNWLAQDPRRVEGPIPVECRSAACGTCWVGVIGGADKLSEVSALEGKRVKLFGYIDTEEAQPPIRLACMARPSGAVSLVIPPWNGVFAKHLSHQDEAAAAPALAESVA